MSYKRPKRGGTRMQSPHGYRATTRVMRSAKDYTREDPELPLAGDCPVCNSHNTRDDYDNPLTMACCDSCGADWIKGTFEIILDPRKIK